MALLEGKDIALGLNTVKLCAPPPRIIQQIIQKSRRRANSRTTKHLYFAYFHTHLGDEVYSPVLVFMNRVDSRYIYYRYFALSIANWKSWVVLSCVYFSWCYNGCLFPFIDSPWMIYESVGQWHIAWLLLGSWCGENSFSTGNKEGILQVGVAAPSW